MQIFFNTASKHNEEDRPFPLRRHYTPPLRKCSCHSVTSSIASNDWWECLSQRRETYFRQLSLVVQTETLYVMDGSRGQGKEILLEWKLGSVGRQLTLHNILVAWPMLLSVWREPNGNAATEGLWFTSNFRLDPITHSIDCSELWPNGSQTRQKMDTFMFSLGAVSLFSRS